MDFDPRWSDDPRDRDDYGRELSQGSRGGLSNPREREPLDARDVFTRDLELPRGRERERVWARDSDVRLRGSEVRTLATVAPPGVVVVWGFVPWSHRAGVVRDSLGPCRTGQFRVAKLAVRQGFEPYDRVFLTW
jgi:hypothetical protein